ncbi:MAG: LamG-like jellyroll fold domain-containing protein, partial [Bacteroidota bacterium]
MHTVHTTGTSVPNRMLVRAFIFSGLTLIFLLAGIKPAAAQTWPLAWSDEFNGTQLDTNSKWNFEVNNWGGGNGEQQYYTARPENVSVSGGCLHLTGRKERYQGSNYTSGRIHNATFGSYTYGHWKIRAKLPCGQGTWPAIWLLPTDEVYNGWPNSGEIDIMEMVGNDSNRVHSTIHYGKPGHGSQGRPDTAINGGDFCGDFHIFELTWTPGLLVFYVDSVESYRVPFDRPFDQRFHVLLNLALGGSWPGPMADYTPMPCEMQVDYVRIYSMPDTAYMEPEIPDPVAAGLEYNYFELGWSVFLSNPSNDVDGKGIMSNFYLPPVHRATAWGTWYYGYINIPADGTYTFCTNSDDGSKFFIGTKQITYNDGQHNLREKCNSVKLKAGMHPVKVGHMNDKGTGALSVTWAGPGFSKQAIPDNLLFHKVRDTLAVDYTTPPQTPTVTSDQGASPIICRGGQTTLKASGLSYNANNALNFATDSAKKNFIKLPNSLQEKFTEGFTFEAWVKPHRNKYYNRIFRFGSDAWDNRIDFQADYGHQNRFGFEINVQGKNYGGGQPMTAPAIEGLNPVNLIIDDRWIHTAFTLDGSTLRLYMNGVLADSFPCPIVPADLGATFNNFIGRGSYSDNADAFIGQLDEVRLWNKARSKAEIQAYMRKSVPSNSDKLVVYYKMDQDGGDYVLDATPNKIHGKMYQFHGTVWRQSSVYGFTSDYQKYTWSPSTGLNTTVGAEIMANPVTTTTYSVRASDWAGNISSARTITVNVRNEDAPKVSPDSVTFCGAASATLTADGNGPWLWSSGETTRTIQATQSGLYTVTTGNCTSQPAKVTLNTSYASKPVIRSANNVSAVCPGTSLALIASNADTGAGNVLNFNSNAPVNPNYIKLPDNINLKLLYGFTYETWFTTTSNPIWGRFLCMGSSLVNRFEMVQNPAGVGRLRLEFTDIGNYTLPETPQLDTSLNVDNSFKRNHKYHLALVMDGDYMIVYINGNVIMKIESMSVPYTFGKTNMNYIGKSAFPNDAAFYGTMDETRMWRVGRTQQQIRDYMYNPVPPASTKDLVFYYKMDGSNNDTHIADSSGNGNHGTFINPNGTLYSPSWIRNFNPYTYNWSPSTGLDNTNRATVSARPAQTTTYTVQSSNIFGCFKSESFTVTGLIPPAIAKQAADAGVCAHQPVGYKIKAATAGNYGPLSYTWQQTLDSGAHWTNVPNTGIFSGTTTDSLHLSDPLPAHSGMKFRCIVAGCSPTVTSDPVWLTVADTGTPAISLNAYPGTSLCFGDSITITSASVFGGSSPAWQWYRNGSPISGANGHTLKTNSLTNGDVITCRLTSSAACATRTSSLSAAMPVSIAPLGALPASVTLSATTPYYCPGTIITFTANAGNGGSNPAYQWKLNGNNVGLGASTYTTLGLAQGDVVSCEMTSAFQCASPKPATSASITVQASAPVATVSIGSAGGTNLCSSNNLFTTTATNTGSNPVYTWKRNGSYIGTGSTFSSPGVVPGDTLSVTMYPSLTCSFPATSSIIVSDIRDLPTVPAIARSRDTVLCAGTPLTLTASSSSEGAGQMLQFASNAHGDNYVKLEDNLHANFKNAFTFEAWIRPTIVSSYTRVFRFGSTAFNRIELLTNVGNNRLGFEGYNNDFPSTTIPTTPQIAGLGTNNSTQTNVWMHVAFTLDGVMRRLYVNGVKIDSIACTMLPYQLAATNENLIGAAYTGNTTAPNFRGQMDEVRLWSVARTEAQIAANMRLRLAGRPAGIFAYYRMDTTAGTFVRDASGLGHHGTLINFTEPVWATSTVASFNPYTYTWTPSYAINTVSGTVATVTPLVPTAYTVTATSPSGCASVKTVNVVVNQTPYFLRHPVNYETCTGSSAKFSALSSGVGFTYQWQESTNNGTDWHDLTNAGLYSGVTDTLLRISSNAFASAGYKYRCKVTGCGSTVTGNSAVLNVVNAGPPTIVIGSNVGTNICAGTGVTFTATTTLGGNTPAYQWLKNGVAIPNATRQTYVNGSLTTGDAITCRLTSSAGCATVAQVISAPLNFTIAAGNLVPAVSIASVAQTVCPGYVQSFSANPVNGGSAPVYQWLLNGTEVSTAATYTSVPLTGGDIVTCRMTSAFPCAIPANVVTTLTVPNLPAAAIVTIASAGGTTLCSSGNVFTATPVNGGSAPAYVWKKNRNTVGTGDTYTDNSLAAGDTLRVTLTPSLSCALPATSSAFIIADIKDVPLTPALTQSRDTVLCKGTAITLTAASSSEGPGNMLQFNSTTHGQNYVLIPNNIHTKFTSGFTFEAWVYPTAVNNYTRFFRIGSNTANRMDFVLNTGNGTRMGFEGSNNFSSGTFTIPTTPAISGLGTNNATLVNTWVHVAFTLDGSKRRLYINGVKVDSFSTTFLPSVLASTTENGLGFAYSGDGGAPAFKGYMDEVRLWSYARNAAKISGDMRNRVAAKSNGLVACYRMDNTTDTIATDATPNALHGRLKNFTGTVWPASTLSNFNPYTYTWFPATGLNTATGKTVTASGDSSRVYTVTVTGPNTCYSTSARHTVVHTKPAITGARNKSSCTPIRLVATGTGPFTWSGSDSTGAAFTARQSGKYKITTAGCGSDSVMVNINAPPVLKAPPGSTTACSGSNATFKASASGDSLRPQWQMSTNGGITFNNIISAGLFTGTADTMLTIAVPGTNMNNIWFRNMIVSPCTTIYSPPAKLTVKGTGTWLGQSAEWTESANWCGGVPDSTRDITIPADAPRVPMVGNGLRGHVGSLTVDSGAGLLLSGTGAMTVHKNLVLHDAVTGSAGSIIFKGVNGKHTITSDARGKLSNLAIDDTAGAVLSGSLRISNSLNFSRGKLSMSVTDTLVLLNGARITGEHKGSYVSGNVLTAKIAGRDSASFAGTGVSLSGGNEDLGTVTLLRKSFSNLQMAPAGAASGLNRAWEINITGTQPTTGRRIHLSWLPDEDNSLNMTRMFVFRQNNANANWTRLNESPVNVWQSAGADGIRSISVNTNHFSTYVLSDMDNPLPVELLYLRGLYTGNAVNLDWSTATEL